MKRLEKNDFEHNPVETFLLAQAAEEMLSGPARVLDLGCGPARTLYEIRLKRPECQYYGLDRVRDRLEQGFEALDRLGAPVFFRAPNYLVDGEIGEINLVEGDLRRVKEWKAWERAFDLIMMNPPYYKQGEGRLPPDSSRAAARHQVAGGLGDFFEAASWLLAADGRIVAIYPAQKEKEFRQELERRRMQIRTFQYFYTGKESRKPAWIIFMIQDRQTGVSEEQKKPVWDLDRYLDYEIETKQ